MKRVLTLPNLILASLVLGAGVGVIAAETGILARAPVLNDALTTGGDLFKALIMMVVMPLVVFSLISGMMSLGDLRKLGRVAGKTLAIYAVTAAAACILALTLVNLARPGHYVPPARRDEIAKRYEAKRKEITAPLTEAERKKANTPTVWTFLKSMVPSNVFEAVVKGQMLPVIFFALFFGLVAASLPDTKRLTLGATFDALTEAMVRMVTAAMWTAPVGVFCLLVTAVAGLGIDVFKPLLVYCLVVLAGLALQFFLVYGGVLVLLTRLKFTDFLRAVRPALVTAFSTSSSAASLGVNMECVTKRLNISTSVSGFVLPIGTTINMDGTAIMQAVAAVFIAQLYSIELGIAGQLTILLTAMLAAVGTAPVPSAGIAMLVLILEPLKIPLEGIALIWAVDRPLDMARTVVNVVGDAVCAAGVAATEGEDVRYLPEVTPT